MDPQTVEALYKRAARWVAIKGIPALVCDDCGETTYPQASVLRIQAIIEGNEAPVEFTWTPQFEFDMAARRPVAAAYTTSLENSTVWSVPATSPPILGRGNTATEAIGEA